MHHAKLVQNEPVIPRGYFREPLDEASPARNCLLRRCHLSRATRQAFAADQRAGRTQRLDARVHKGENSSQEGQPLLHPLDALPQ